MKNFLIATIFFAVISITNFANAAEIDRAYYLGDADISYPVVIAKNSAATQKINEVIRAEVQKILENANAVLEERTFNSMTIDVDYQVPCNHDGGTLSIILTAYVNYENSAHPSNSYYGLNFNSVTGERIFSDSLSYTPQVVTQKLKKYAAQKGFPLNIDFQGLSEVPENFYYGDNMHVHFIFNQYEVAAYAVGIIDLDMATN